MQTQTPVIVHLDLDCFFAAVEQSRRPELSAKPVVVGADPKVHWRQTEKGTVGVPTGRGVVATANYDARKFGIRSAMPISQAYRLCPQAVFLQGDYREYGRVSQRVMDLARRFFPKMEQNGIDEAFFLENAGFEEAARKAEEVRRCIQRQERITASAGIAWNKTIAKIATDLKKPDGLTVIRPEELESRVWPLAAGKLRGVGKKTQERLEKEGIRTIGDLAKTHPAALSGLFGSFGFGLHACANGFGSTTLSEGREATFSEDVSETRILEDALRKLCLRVHRDVEQEQVCFRTVTVKIRFEDFETHTKSRTVRATQAEETVVQTAKSLARPAFSGKKKVRLLGVRLSHFSHGAGQTGLSSFMEPETGRVE